MFKNNLNSMDATAATIYKLPDEFKQFRTNVFRNDFNETRQKYGTECKYISIAYNFVSFLNIDIFSHMQKSSSIFTSARCEKVFFSRWFGGRYQLCYCFKEHCKFSQTVLPFRSGNTQQRRGGFGRTNCTQKPTVADDA